MGVYAQRTSHSSHQSKEWLRGSRVRSVCSTSQNIRSPLHILPQSLLQSSAIVAQSARNRHNPQDLVPIVTVKPILVLFLEVGSPNNPLLVTNSQHNPSAICRNHVTIPLQLWCNRTAIVVQSSQSFSNRQVREEHTS